jgi:hypothetical protein
MDWGSVATGNQSAAPATINCGWVITPGEVGEAFVDPTLIRSTFSIGAQQTATSNRLEIYIGMIAWNGIGQQNLAVCPDPIDGSFDWIINGAMLQPPASGQIPRSDTFCSQSDRFESKAMRRLGNDTGLLWVVSTGVNTATNIDYMVFIRYLLKE